MANGHNRISACWQLHRHGTEVLVGRQLRLDGIEDFLTVCIEQLNVELGEEAGSDITPCRVLARRLESQNYIPAVRIFRNKRLLTRKQDYDNT